MPKSIRLIILTCLLSICFGSSAQTLIVHPDINSAQLNHQSLRSIFAMRTPTWSDGRLIRVFVLPDDHPQHKLFCKKQLGMFPYQLRRIWDRQVFSGTGIAPITVNSFEDMLNKVATTPGAIGYIDEHFLMDSVHVMEAPK